MHKLNKYLGTDILHTLIDGVMRCITMENGVVFSEIFTLLSSGHFF